MEPAVYPGSSIGSGRRTGRGRRVLRKHRLAFILWGVVVVLLVLPSIFAGRVLSPNDVYYTHDPWRTLRQVDSQNPLLSDPPSSWMPLWAMVKSQPDTFHWNPWIGGGIPGWGSAAAAVLSPVILFPILVVPLLFSYLAIVLTKFTLAFAFTYGWLREERLGRSGAAVGALIFSACGLYSVWWLWQATNAVVFYPAVLWVLRRAFSGRRTPLALQILLALALALSGYPATTIFAAWIALLYAIWLAVSTRRLPLAAIARGAVAVVLAVAIAAPMLAPFASFVRRSGYLESREGVAAAGMGRYPLRHFEAFFDPWRLGNPGDRLWLGDPELGISNNFNESTIYLGFLTIPLALVGLFRRRRSRWFWGAFAAVLIVLIFAVSEPLGQLAGSLPGIRYSPLARLRFLLPVPVAWLAAAGTGVLLKRRGTLRLALVGLVAAWLVLDLGTFAVRYLPFPRFEVASLPDSPSITYLQRQASPARVAPFFDYLWPNSAQLVRLEDVRSHFGSELRWRQLLDRFAPGSFGSSGTVIQFNSLRFDFDDPLVSFLNIEWLAEQPSIDILRWRISDQTTLKEPVDGSYRLLPGRSIRQLVVREPGASAIDLNFDRPLASSGGAAVVMELTRPETGRAVWKRRVPFRELTRLPKVYVPLSPFAREGNALLLTIRMEDLAASVPRGESGDLAWGVVRSPVILETFQPDGRLFRNLAARDRFFPVWDVDQMPFEQFLANREIDLTRTAVITDQTPLDPLHPLASISPAERRAVVRTDWSPSRAVVEVSSGVPLLLASSEKITPELEITVDGAVRQPIEINGMFAAVPLEAGEHRVVFDRQIGRGLWIPSAIATAVAILASLADSLRRRRQLRRSATKMN